MFATPAFAQTAGDAASGGMSGQLLNILPIVFLMVLFYFLLIRPQQKRMKEHQSMVSALKRGDTVVLASGVIGKVSRVDERELGVEIADGVTVKVVRSMVTEVRAKSEPAPANDAKA